MKETEDKIRTRLAYELRDQANRHDATIEEQVLRWVYSQQENNVAVSGVLIQNKALEIHD